MAILNDASTEPQSILHQVIRLEQSIVRSIKKTSSWGSPRSSTPSSRKQLSRILQNEETNGEKCKSHHLKDKEEGEEVETDTTTESFSLSLTDTEEDENRHPGTHQESEHDKIQLQATRRLTDWIGRKNAAPTLELSFLSPEPSNRGESSIARFSHPSFLSVSEGASVLSDDEDDDDADAGGKPSYDDQNEDAPFDSEYRTLTLEEFEDKRYFRRGDCFVHIFAKEDEKSRSIDLQMKKLASSFCSVKTYFRICGTEAYERIVWPHGKAPKTGNCYEPTVVALKRGLMTNRISEFHSEDCEELVQWASTIELLNSLGKFIF